MNLIKEVLNYLPEIINLIGMVILLIGFVRSGLHYFKMELFRIQKKGDKFKMMGAIRSEMGLYILLALDFIIIADILNSMIYNDINSLITLAAIVLIRTFIGYFLEKEVKEIHTEQENYSKKKLKDQND